MFEFIKQRIIKKLIEEIGCLSPTNLEIIGNKVVSLIEDKRMVHHGINKDYKPSGYTIDSFTDDSLVTAEYSTEKKYFKDSSKKDNPIPSYEKIENDINHVLTHNSPEKIKKIYLISSQEEPSSFRSKFNKTPLAELYGEKIIIYDSRELAKLIYEQSNISIDAASFYKQFFPGYSKDLDNYEYYGKAPSFCDNHVKDINLTNTISKHFQNNNICILYGISGSGKTQMAIDYLHSEKNNFENYIWISGEDWKQNQSFSSIQRTRGGSPLNIAGIFNLYKTILIIDNLERLINISDLHELTVGLSNGSKILITSQLSKSNDANYLSIPQLSDEIAYKIIGEDLEQKTNLTQTVINLCKFSPLILSTIKKLSDEEGISREELYQEVLKSPQEITNSEGKSIMRNILAKLEPNALTALKQIANSGITTNDSEFLAHFIGSFNRITLQRLSILLPSNLPGFLKIHDLVCASVKDNPNTEEICSAISKYIAKNNANMSPSVLRQIHLCYEVLVKEHNSLDQKNWITYALLQIEGIKRQQIQQTLHNEQILPHMTLASILCLIDSKEAYAYSLTDENEKNEYFKKCIEEYKNALKKVSNNEIKVEILHHLGKTLRRSGEFDESLKTFQQLLSLEPNMHATYLQIAHIGSQKGVAESFKKTGSEYLEKLFSCIFNNYSTVPLRVSLGSLARLRSYKKISNSINLNQDDVQKLSDIIVISSLEGFGQFFEAFVSFTSIFNYNHSSICINLAETIPELLTTSPQNVDSKNWLNASEGLTNIAISALRDNKEKLSKKISNISLAFADKIYEMEELTSFEGRSLAKTYLTANLPQKALLAIEKVPQKSYDHWLVYQKAKIELKISTPNCYNSAVEAFTLASKDSVGIERISIYHDLLSQCAESQGKINEAIIQAKHAISTCNNDKYKNNLENRLEELEKI
ncbi:hypothetical protein [Flavobacterium sp. WG21]|uniref:hypothetical protein n=1 Tax=Flavobacterium sp. WG21 TaxID=1229487 RepID=UPI00034A02DA|nr:hypothetical protein [Flavobacterium sp. WG21]